MSSIRPPLVLRIPSIGHCAQLLLRFKDIKSSNKRAAKRKRL